MTKHASIIEHLITYRKNNLEEFRFTHCAGIVCKNKLIIKGDKFHT